MCYLRHCTEIHRKLDQNHPKSKGFMEIVAASHLISMSAPPIDGGALAVDDGRIVAVGPLSQLRREFGAPVREFPGCALMPGLVNAHTHLELTHFPAWKLRKGFDYAPRTYVDWVIQLIKIRRGLTQHEVELSLREGFRISLESGTTSVGDILSDWRLLPDYRGSSLSGRLFFELLGHDPLQCDGQLERLEQIFDDFSCGNLQPGVSPHAPHTVSADYFRNIIRFAAQRSVPVSVHAAESREESEFLHDTSGGIAEVLYPFVHWEQYLHPPRRTTPVSYLDELGVLEHSPSLVHCVHATGADAEIMKKHGITVILCPRSNDRLVVGKAPVQLFRKAGIPVALATDSLASNDSLSLWDEMRFFRRQFPTLFSPSEILEMVTVNAAQALWVADQAGSLEKGKRADFLIMKLPKPSVADLCEALIEEGQLEEVFLNGAPV